MNEYFWKKKTFSNRYQIFQNKEKVGYIETPSFLSKTSKGVINAEKYVFVSKNWSNTKINVFKNQDSLRLAEIEFIKLRTKAKIVYNDEIFQFKFLDIWQTQWEIIQNNKPIIKSKDASHSHGKAMIKNEDRELLLLALYASNYYYVIGLFLIIVIIVLVITT